MKGLFVTRSIFAGLPLLADLHLEWNPCNPNACPSETGKNVNNFAETGPCDLNKSYLLIIPLINELLCINEIALLQLFLQ